MRRPLFLIPLVALAGCSLQTPYVQPVLPVPSSFPTGDPYPVLGEAAPARIVYSDVFTDPRLQTLIGQALVNNRDLRIAAANILSARALYRIQRADLLPGVGATGRYTRSGGDNAPGGGGEAYLAQVGVTAFEIDLFGRVRSLNDAALNRYFATEAAARATRVTLIADLAEAWLSYAADASLLQVAQDTVTSAQDSVRLTDARLKGGIAPRTDLRQAQAVLTSAQADVASLRTTVARDLNALQLLLGGPVDAALLPVSIVEASAGLQALPVGLSSTVLLNRPDVAQAEFQLRAANAQIGAARAALFPTISLTGALGYGSSALSSLFTGGAFSYSVAPNLSYSIFNAGAVRAGVDQSRAQRDAAVATYERSIQAAFVETANALARQGTIDDELAARAAGAAAAQDSYALTDARYRGGVDPFLTSLDAQRTLYAAQRSRIAIELQAAVNRVALYRAIGGS